MNSAGLGDPLPGAGWDVCGASVIGREHQRRGLGCDDAFSYGVVGDFVVAAVADGAGSVTGTSAWGSYVACRSVLANALRPDFLDSYRGASSEHAETLMAWLFEKALKRVIRHADEQGLDPALLSTTLCVGLADSSRAVFGQVGDGVIAAERDGRIDTLLIEEKDEYANITSFLQSERALQDAFGTSVHDGVTAFGLSTDGMVYKITDVATGQAYQPFFRDSWRHVRAGADSTQFAALLSGIEDDQTGDDKTVVLATVRDAGGNGPGGGVITGHSPAPDGSDACAMERDSMHTRAADAESEADEMTVPITAATWGGRRFGRRGRNR